jgi:hypothetical protein
MDFLLNVATSDPTLIVRLRRGFAAPTILILYCRLLWPQYAQASEQKARKQEREDMETERKGGKKSRRKARKKKE